MKMMLTCFLAFSLFSSAAFANPSSPGLLKAIEEFHYALTVEWDQKDMSFYQQQVRMFEEEVQKLPLAQENRKQLLLEAVSLLPESRHKQDVMKLLLQLNDEFITPERMNSMLTELLRKSSAEGTNWNGSGSLEAALVVGLLVMIMVVIISSDQRDNDEERRYRIPPYTVEPIMDPYPDFGCDVYPMCDKYRP